MPRSEALPTPHNFRHSSSSRSLAARLEGALWLSRPQSLFSQVPIALAAWSIGSGGLASSQPIRVIALIVFLAAFQAAMFVVNDLYDADSDKVTAPYMPLPSGLVSRRAAIAEAVLLGAVFVGSILVMGQDRAGIWMVLATIPLALLTLKIYGASKAAWYCPLLGSSTFASAALWAWLLAGRQNGSAFGILFAAAALHGIHANVRAQLRDIAVDPKAGHMTLAARMGAKSTMWLAAAARLLQLIGAWFLWLTHGRRGGWVWLAIAFAVFAFACSRMSQVYRETRDRIGQTKALSLWVFLALCAEIALLGVLEPIAAIPTAVVMLVWFNSIRSIYYKRLVYRFTPAVERYDA